MRRDRRCNRRSRSRRKARTAGLSTDHDRVRKMASPLRIEEPALEGRARDRAHAWVAGGSPVGKGLVAQHAAGESTWVAGRTGAGSRRWNGAARLILLHHTLLRAA